MDERSMIALGVVLEDQFPIGFYLINDSPGGSQRGQIPMREFASQGRKDAIQRQRSFRKAHKNETFPQTERQRVQRIIRFLEPLDALHVRSADQTPVEAIGPGMVRTLNGAAQVPALVLAQS